ncbi:protocatechuate 3,4-dioxygenase subunit alpha [Rhodococcus sp. WMMA185]|uniref:protocatechuate 3,4-dioxygenase subunit alpha n=1 Tax=Rhodococcus sp. WMMA185 TaxID=679318 RepID=UPI000878E95F|nr:protocatechuate 3,4-dioxygenase subunit alpha [Rhodococcus sp. WMMA185]AOW92974.1 protocatechuate 3,4-dioxygenase subunit alpha [Rhodococcus sp. WMMA185]
MIDTQNPDAPRYPVFGRSQDEVPFGITPSQTVGPYVHIGLYPAWENGGVAVPEGTPGRIEVSFTVIDGAGEPVSDAMIETWQADAAGRFESPGDPRGAAQATPAGFRSLARVFADETGAAVIHTVKPGALPTENGGNEAPHINVGVFARGMLERLFTRLYFPDDTEAHASDPVLAAVPEPDRPKLIAERTDRGYHLTIHVQSDDGRETPFFAL